MTAVRSTRITAAGATRQRSAGLARAFACVALGVLAAAPSGAQEKGDQYEITVRMEMKGVPMALPPQTTKVCMAKNAKDESFVPQRGTDCKVVRSNRTGNTLSYRMECAGKDAMVAEGEITYAGDSYTGKMHMTGAAGGEPFEMNQTYSGKKIGECANPMR